MEERVISDNQRKVILALRTDDATLLSASFPIEKINNKNGFGQTPLFYACTLGSHDCVRWLLENGANADVMCPNTGVMETPLYTACHHARNYQCVDLLLGLGRAYITPGIMVDAIHKDRREMTRLLLSYGGSVRVSCWKPAPPWWTELLQARERCRRAAVVLLGIRRLRRSAVLKTNGMDVIRLVARHVWRTQLLEKWGK